MSTTDTTTTTKPAWYQTSVTAIDPAAQSMLESYSGLAPEEVISHVLALRDEAFQIFPYPCIGQMRFLSCHLSRLPFYDHVLARLRASPANGFLDAGCCVGQELRHLVYAASIPPFQLYGFDLEAGFFELGYKLFRDNAETFPATFVGADLGVSDEEWEKTEIVAKMRGKIDIIWAGSLLHFWDYEGQLRGVERLIGLTRGEVGMVVCGRQMGSTVAGVYDLTGLTEKTMLHYRHDVVSFERMWRDIGEKTGSRWDVQAELEVGETTTNMRNKARFMDDNARIIWWCAMRVE
ncbi:hypothetical protein BDQ94DRAFT_84240 [Aspergillus welwitschiae]|uniref:Methyltransferase domain-containing protein n=1 Tax=Aspergillus welwitschiae TaxID=1341132 RepID=A0A3F3PRH0_9EURO|nr:hypothetical protein BDQ94DRAFT_84240 [Aspergillus welwitschiae]RDH29535.1 hypothetical protein BDQ94DRAFT_84240 [Aspergillus welwitschiae]